MNQLIHLTLMGRVEIIASSLEGYKKEVKKKMETSEVIKNYKDCIGWVRHFALPNQPVKDFRTADILILVTFRSDEHYIFRYFNEFGLIDAFLIQNLLDRITKYTQEAFMERSCLNKTLEIYEYKKEV